MEESVSRPGQRVLGKYTLIAQLAHGGMGEICLARQHGMAGFEKIVVIKRVLPHLAEDRKYIDMLLDEGRIAARLVHQNICQVLELGEVDGEYYIALEYLEGVALSDLLRRMVKLQATMDPRLATCVIYQACEGLHYAHEVNDSSGAPTNLVHRDVSPSNLFITSSGLVKVLDFGIAKTPDKRSQTRTGTVKGKWAYMSPEQVLRQSLDRRSDIFSLGVVLFEALTSRRLFRRPSEYETCEAIVNSDVPPLRSLRPDLPEVLEQVVARALARNPADRFATARELSRALHGALRTLGGLASFSELGDLVSDTFAEQLQERRLFIERLSTSGDASLGELPTAPSADIGSSTDSDPVELDEGTQDTRSIAPPTLSGQLLPVKPRPRAVVTEQSSARLSPPVIDSRVAVPASPDNQAGMSAAPSRPGRGWLPWALLALSVIAAGSAVFVFLRTRSSQSQVVNIMNYGGGIELDNATDAAPVPATVPPPPGPPEPDTSAAKPVPADASVRPRVRRPAEQGTDSGKSSRDQYGSMLRRSQGKLRSCLDQHASSLSGTVTITFKLSIQESGKVSAASLLPAVIEQEEVGQCMLGVVRGIDFGARPAAVAVRIPLEIRLK